jgi:hypothetical protein
MRFTQLAHVIPTTGSVSSAECVAGGGEVAVVMTPSILMGSI